MGAFGSIMPGEFLDLVYARTMDQLSDRNRAWYDKGEKERSSSQKR